MLWRWVWRGLGVPLSWGRVPLAGPAVPAIHRGQHPRAGISARGICAHDATNLFYRGHSHPLQALTTAVIAHGELQERPVGKNSHSPCADGFPPVIL